ncbi:6055_t:CDS:1, partial [Gigaspora margarita]
LYEIKENGFFNDIIREIIIEKMDKIGVGFEFWQDKLQIWKNISLIGEDKLKYFNFLTLSRYCTITREIS